MRRAFVDSSALLAIIFDEPAAEAMRARLRQFDAVHAAPLAEAEVRSAARRENVHIDEAILGALEWVNPHRDLSSEIKRVLAAGYVRGADCWHLAAALYFVATAADIAFLTLDARQQSVAAALGFAV